MGLKVEKRGPDETIYFVYDQFGQLIYEGSTDGNYLEYIHALGKHPARVDGSFTYASGSDPSCAESQTSYCHCGQVGTVEAVTDAGGNVVWKAQYTAFGKILSAESYVAGFEQDPVFSGKTYDPGIERYYFNARWYDPTLGRFISEDPIRDSFNWYTAMANNPMVYIDPTGLGLVDIATSIWSWVTKPRGGDPTGGEGGYSGPDLSRGDLTSPNFGIGLVTDGATDENEENNGDGTVCIGWNY